MPSGSKKRKSSKKPKSQGGPPELDAGLEEAMANTGEEVGEDILSPVGIEGDPEAIAERGFNGNKVYGEVLQEESQEDSQIDVAAPDHDVVGQGNPPPPADREPEIPAAIEAVAPAVFESEGETVQQETEPEMKSLVKNDAISEEPKSEVESDAGRGYPELVVDEAVSNRDVGGPGDPPPPDVPEPEIPAAIEVVAPAVIEPEGETVLQETEPQIDIPVIDVTPEVEFDAGPVDLEQPAVDAAPDVSPDEIKPDAGTGLDEIEVSKESANVKREFELDAAPLGNELGIDDSFVESAYIEPETDKGPDELDAAAARAEVESEIGEPLVEVKPEVDAAPYMEQETDETLNEVPVEMEPETLTQIQPEAQVEEPETATPTAIEAEAEVVPTDVKAEGAETQVDEPETAATVDVEPETEESPSVTDAPYIAEVEEAPLERELATVAASADDEPETDAAPVDIEAEVNNAQVEKDASQDEAPREIDAAFPENETESDVAARDFESEADAAVAELEPPTEVSSVEPETDAAPVDIEAETNTAQVEAGALQDEAPRELDAANPENETETDVAAREFESEADATVAELEPPTEVSSVEIEPEEGAEPTSVETIPQPEPQVEPLVEGEAEVNAEDVAAPEPEPEMKALVEEPEVNVQDVENSAEIEARTASSQETESEPKPLDLAEDTSFEPLQDIEPELEAEATDKAKLEDEASIEAKAEERGPGETEFNQEDFVEELETASKVSPEPEVETMNGIDMEAETEPPPEAEPGSVVEIPAETEVDEKDLIHTEAGQQDLVETETDQSGVKEQDVIQEGEPEIGELESFVSEDNGPSESQLEVVETPEVPPAEDEASPVSASEAAIPIDEAISEISDNTDKEKTGSRPEMEEGEEVIPLATAVEGSGDEVNVEELAKEGIIDQKRAVDVAHGENEAVLESAGNGSGAEVSSEQELGSEQLLPADVVDVEESTKEVPLPSDQEPAIEQPQPLIDEQDPRMVQDAAAEQPPSVESEQSLNAYLTSDASAPLDEAITPASAENFALEPEVNLASATGEPERDTGEEEAASSTAAEAGSVLNDFDERASCEQELPTDFSSTEQDGDISEGKEADENLSTALPESVKTGSREQLESEPFPADANTVCQVEATHEQPEVVLENTEAAKPAKDLESAIEELPSDEPVPSPQSEQVVQDSGEAEVLSSKEVVLANEEPRTREEERALCEDDEGAPFPNIAGDMLISKASKYFGNGQQSLGNSEAPSNDLVEKRDGLSVNQGEANNMDKAEIHAMDSKDSKEAEPNAIGGEANHHADDAPVERPLPVSEGRDIKDFQAFRQGSTQEASLPLVISTQDRAVEQHAKSKNEERPSGGGGTLKRRTKLLDCCGMFDLLLKKN